ncbi:MAG: hypothetical protein MI924_35040 [Chloroflexales bacterium]|nr:hypothetical protein [Chloroflexales bacterium]
MPKPTLIFAALACCALLLAGVASQPNSAVAQPEAPEGVDWIIPQVERYDAEMLAQRQNITPMEAATMLARQPAIGELRAKLVARDDDNFAGLWVTGTSPETQRVMVAFKDNLDAELALLRADFPYPELLQGVAAARSYSELRALYQQTIDQRNSLAAADARRIDIMIDEPANEIKIYAPADLLATLEAMVADASAIKVIEAQHESADD